MMIENGALKMFPRCDALKYDTLFKNRVVYYVKSEMIL